MPLCRPARTYGIIPARAGFTSCFFSFFVFFVDHPRSRGVYAPRPVDARDSGGSSPLARGLLGLKSAYKSRVRIIPARAGFTCPVGGSGDCEQDHPRSRGVYGANRIHARPHEGSSPLARGLPKGTGDAGANRRIIPARAGFTRSHLGIAAEEADHPRSRGVYHLKFFGGRLNTGSSPLARGLPIAGKNLADQERIIPARAGFTPSLMISFGL